jgi:hypothetical protein
LASIVWREKAGECWNDSLLIFILWVAGPPEPLVLSSVEASLVNFSVLLSGLSESHPGPSDWVFTTRIPGKKFRIPGSWDKLGSVV